MTVWKPISTAPRDGTRLLGYFPFRWASGERASAIDVFAWDSRAGFWFFPTPKNYVQKCEVEPTHWQPLPDAPDTPRHSLQVNGEGGGMSGWVVAPIALKCEGKDGPIDHIVAGWVNGPFGLDFRVFKDAVGEYVNDGFVLTHLPTGFVVRQLVGVGTAEAKALADEILESADWSFTGKPKPEHGAAVKAAMAKHPGKIASGHSLRGPGI